MNDLIKIETIKNSQYVSSLRDLYIDSGMNRSQWARWAKGNVTGNTTSDVLTNPISYFYFQSADAATTSGVKGGGPGCSAGPVTLEAL